MTLDEILPKTVRDAIAHWGMEVTQHLKDKYGPVKLISFTHSQALPTTFMLVNFDREGRPQVVLSYYAWGDDHVLHQQCTSHRPDDPDLPELIVTHMWPARSTAWERTHD